MGRGCKSEKECTYVLPFPQLVFSVGKMTASSDMALTALQVVLAELGLVESVELLATLDRTHGGVVGWLLELLSCLCQ